MKPGFARSEPERLPEIGDSLGVSLIIFGVKESPVVISFGVIGFQTDGPAKILKGAGGVVMVAGFLAPAVVCLGGQGSGK